MNHPELNEGRVKSRARERAFFRTLRPPPRVPMNAPTERPGPRNDTASYPSPKHMDTDDMPKAPPGDGAPSILTHPDDARAMTAQMAVVNAFFSAAPRNIPRQDSGEGVANVLMSLGAREPVLCGSARTTKTSAPPVSGQIF